MGGECVQEHLNIRTTVPVMYLHYIFHGMFTFTTMNVILLQQWIDRKAKIYYTIVPFNDLPVAVPS